MVSASLQRALLPHCLSALFFAARLTETARPLRTGHLPDPKEVGHGSPTLPRRPAAAGENVATIFHHSYGSRHSMQKSYSSVYSRGINCQLVLPTATLSAVLSTVLSTVAVSAKVEALAEAEGIAKADVPPRAAGLPITSFF